MMMMTMRSNNHLISWYETSEGQAEKGNGSLFNT
jgi:hypothetical protein